MSPYLSYIQGIREASKVWFLGFRTEELNSLSLSEKYRACNGNTATRAIPGQRKRDSRLEKTGPEANAPDRVEDDG